jgi:hypothetical protein
MSQSGGKTVFLATIAFLSAVALLPFLRNIGFLPAPVIYVLAASIGCGFMVYYNRTPMVRSYLTVLSSAIIIVPAVFLFYSPIWRLHLTSPGAASVNSVKIMSKTPVIMVVFDEFPSTALMDEHHDIDSVRFPNFHMLSRSAYWYRNATTVGDGTVIAVPAILTGKLPDSTRYHYPTYDDYPNNLFTWLGSSYELFVNESITSLCPPELVKNKASGRTVGSKVRAVLPDLAIIYLHAISPKQAEPDLPPIDKNWGGFTQGGKSANDDSNTQTDISQNNDDASDDLINGFILDRRKQFKGFLSSIENTPNPRLYYLHILLPHVPLEFLPDGTRYLTDWYTIPGLDGEMWRPDDWLVRQAYRRFLLQTEYVDNLVGQLIAKLRAEELYDRSLVIICADHGVSFHPNDSRRPLTATNWPDILPVPLFVKVPGQQKGGVSDRNVETIDILPTIGNVLNAPVPWKSDGVSLFDTVSKERNLKSIFGGFGEFEQQSFKRFSSSFDEKYEALRYQVGLFGSHSRMEATFATDKYRRIIGRPVGELAVSSAAGPFRVWLDGEATYSDMDPDAEYLQTEIRGRIIDSRRYGARYVAVAVNDKIAAVTRTRADSSGQFTTIVDGSVFRRGKNSIQIMLIAGKDESPELRRPEGAAYYRLLPSSDGPDKLGSIEMIDGEHIPILKSPDEHGAINNMAKKKGFLMIEGWAADVRDTTVPDNIIAFLGNTFLYIGSPGSMQRSDLASVFQSPLMRNAGFSFSRVLAATEKGANGAPHIFAVFKNRGAYELEFRPFYSAALPVGYSMIRDSKGQEVFIKSPGGAMIPVSPNGFEGYVDGFNNLGSTFEIKGWATDKTKKKRVKSVEIFLDGKDLLSLSIGTDRPDLVVKTGDRTLGNSGFYYQIPFTSLGATLDSTALVQFFAVSEDETSATELFPEQHPFANTITWQSKQLASNYDLQKDSLSHKEFIRSGNGRVIPIRSSGMTARLDECSFFDHDIHMRGWAADTKAGEIADCVAMFWNGTNMLTISTGVDRADLYKGYGLKSLIDAGFDYECPLISLSPGTKVGPSIDKSTRIRFFGIAKDEKFATELSYPKTYPFNIFKGNPGTAPEGGKSTIVDNKYDLRNDRGGTEHLIFAKKTIPVIRDRISGVVDGFTMFPGEIELKGWAADIRNNEPAREVAVFLDGKNVLTLEVGVMRSDLVQAFRKQGLEFSGFYYSVPEAVFQHLSKTSRVRVIAISRSGEVASELQYTERYPLNVFRGNPTTVSTSAGMSKLLPEHFQDLAAIGAENNALVTAAGRKIPLSRERILGYLDMVRVDSSNVEIKGWAFDHKEVRPASMVAIFVNGEHLLTLSAGVRRIDLVQGYGRSAMLGAGFHMTIPRTALGHSVTPSSEFRCFGISADGQTASEVRTLP